jgi:hypothetical protein
MDRKDTGAKRVGQEFKIAFLGNKRKAEYVKNQKVRMPSGNYIHCLVLLPMPKDNMSLEISEPWAVHVHYASPSRLAPGDTPPF